ncbi:MAG: glycosyl hydrolase [Symbiobacteriaceae bacterium]|jgi:beta-glucosidase|nr:glycosyl hydrolase [Symbiobacteriaceae bacterium]
MEQRIEALLAQMTLEEKVALTTGVGNWNTRAVERLGLPAIAVSDGPHGLRKIRPGSKDPLEQAIPATCFPTASALAATWNPELIREVGAAIGDECQAQDVQVLLGPGVNMKRTPLCGRNFEYFSEDPVLAGAMGAAMVQGVQSRGVGTSLKHFACNNQEFERMTISAEVDERTLREIYLPAFEQVVKQAAPWTVMCAYNQVNGTPASEHHRLLTEILRDEWGFDGLVVSDWGAVTYREKSLAAGLDLTMPGAGDAATERIVQLVRDGVLPETVVDQAAVRVLRLVLRGLENRQGAAGFDAEAHHALARRAAAEAIVLLKNDRGVLPIEPEHVSRLAVIGRFAKQPRIQGKGSAHVNPTRTESAYGELERLLAGQVALRYADGYPEEDVDDEALVTEAVALARQSDVAVIFAGLPDAYESESYDRKHIDLPPAQNRLIAAVCQAQPQTVVVLANGSAVAMPWIGGPAAVLEGWLAGQAAGGAVADVLLGRVNPSGKLSETFPVRLEDTPALLNYPGEEGRVRYGERIFIGYRYYERAQVKPLFPFGHGLSYTTFAFTGLSLSSESITDQEPLAVTVTVRNTGARAGQEVVQVYVRDVESSVMRPVKELKAFAKVNLAPGEEQQVRFTLQPRDFAYYSPERRAWWVEAGQFEILVGPSSAKLPLRATVNVAETAAGQAFTPFTLVKYFFGHPVAGAALLQLVEQKMGAGSVQAEYIDWVLDMPLIKVAHLLTKGTISEAEVEALVEQVNAAVREG